MIALAKPRLSVEDYLQGEDGSEILHEYIDGEVYAMSGANDRHNLIGMSIAAAMRHHLRGGPSRVFVSGLKLRVRMAGQDIFYYPDAMVACDPADNHRHYREHPTVLVEVISESTRRVDTREKLSTYISIPSLREYVMIAQDSVEATVLLRDRHWKPQILKDGH